MSDPKSRLTLLQVSDIHLGSREANQRLFRVQHLVRDLVAELSGDCKILPVVSGDLMDTPTNENANQVLLFLDFISGLGTEPPLEIVGNHDVRRNGFLDPAHATAFRILDRGIGVRWFEDSKVGVVSFNSVISGSLARGLVGEQQLRQIGTMLERKKNAADFSLLGVLHHHPTPVEIPDWYSQPFYARVLGAFAERTEELKDSARFLKFVDKKRLIALLHGHKHIPRIGFAGARHIPVYGCGSTVGKVHAEPPSIYMSINVITLDTRRRRISGRLLAERIPGGGLVESKRHELIYGAEI